MSDESVWPSATMVGRLSRRDAAAYLTRLSLPHALLDSRPSLDLLRQLQSAHVLAVPFESLSIHVGDWHDDEAEINLGGGELVGLGDKAFNRIVNLNRGGFCFSANSSFATLLRYWDFRVSECAARVFSHLRKDPEDTGFSWEPTSHQISVVDWDGSDGRYFADIGFGSGNCVYPIPFHDGATQTSIPTDDFFELHCTDRLPGSSPHLQPDMQPYWTVWRRAARADGSSYMSPLYSFVLQSVAAVDFAVLNNYQYSSTNSRFRTMLVSTILRSNGERRTLVYLDGMTDDEGKKAAKVYTMTAVEEGKREEEKEIEWVPMRVGPMRRVLERDFGMRFPAEYAGN
ncbi:hypothetical protein NBRC10512_003680 [Rhodotorula toruloides]|uniref:RHTO0S13e02872g1_1 n=2 Tax=Rhodotorula toruloides TaxID=5286 RepID=A0A061BG60_RHOTO|nr:arylamine N-acetyltransferase [Rhodotorula toruloides NP11]EMS22464.1 arylamine N-acetyltransferase [Rhodotorula toruloides NP11]KAJ8295143.1 Arylamine N-acetyltransferase [Rhodotorula toruloides]CDR46880.1 RHTO0S13e02872g1_1 [Rhodotorula toruloides]